MNKNIIADINAAQHPAISNLTKEEDKIFCPTLVFNITHYKTHYFCIQGEIMHAICTDDLMGMFEQLTLTAVKPNSNSHTIEEALQVAERDLFNARTAGTKKQGSSTECWDTFFKCLAELGYRTYEPTAEEQLQLQVKT